MQQSGSDSSSDEQASCRGGSLAEAGAGSGAAVKRLRQLAAVAAAAVQKLPRCRSAETITAEAAGAAEAARAALNWKAKVSRQGRVRLAGSCIGR